MLPQSLSAAQGKTLEAPVHQSSPRNALPAVSPRQNLSQIGGRHLSPHQSPGSGIFCRICHEGDFLETLLSPCSCSGSVGVVHRSCLEKWLSSSQYDTCELCRQPLTVTRTYRSILQWLCQGESSGDDQRNLVGDSVCLMLLTPLATVSAYLCSSGASYYAKQGQVAEAAGLVGLCSVLCLVYLLWLLLTARYHCQVWFKWRNENQEIKLLGFSSGPKKRAGEPGERSAAVVAGEDTGRERVVTLEESTVRLMQALSPPRPQSSTEDQICKTSSQEKVKGCLPPSRSSNRVLSSSLLLKPPSPHHVSSQP